MCVLKEEIKAVYGYNQVYSVPTVSQVNKLTYSNNRQRNEQSDKKETTVGFADVFEKSLNESDKEVIINRGYIRNIYILQENIVVKKDFPHRQRWGKCLYFRGKIGKIKKLKKFEKKY